MPRSKDRAVRFDAKAVAASIAEEIGRLGHRREGEYDADWTMRIIKRHLSDIEDRYDAMASAVRKVLDRERVKGGSNRAGAASNRLQNVRSTNGYHDECDLCHACPDRRSPTFSLSIGGYKARIMLDVCFPCGRRIVQVVKARLEDRRVNHATE